MIRSVAQDGQCQHSVLESCWKAGWVGIKIDDAKTQDKLSRFAASGAMNGIAKIDAVHTNGNCHMNAGGNSNLKRSVAMVVTERCEESSLMDASTDTSGSTLDDKRESLTLMTEAVGGRPAVQDRE